MDARSVAMLRDYTTELLGFLAAEHGRLFAHAYMDPSPAYHRAGAT